MNRGGFLQLLGTAALGVHPLARIAAPVAATDFVSRYVHRTYALAFAFTNDLITQGEWEGIGSAYAKHLEGSMIETKETLVANILTRAFNS